MDTENETEKYFKSIDKDTKKSVMINLYQKNKKETNLIKSVLKIQ